jgi:phage host-nuclease inhibitor protein Gam
MSVYSTLEKLIADSNLTGDQRRQLIANEIAAFKKLKQQVEAQRAGAKHDQTVGFSGSNGQYIDQRKFEEAMGNIEKRLTGQVANLKTQIESLQKEIDALRNH